MFGVYPRKQVNNDDDNDAAAAAYQALIMCQILF